jgi:serine/threonine protein kinase
MGEVYRARDSRLGRDVAIKTSKVAFDDRFQREARAIDALNHPNVCTLYDVGPDYLVMEYVEGQTLADRIVSEAAAAESENAPYVANASYPPSASGRRSAV